MSYVPITSKYDPCECSVRNMLHVYFITAASAPSNLMAVQEGPTSIRISWTPPTPLGITTGYRIYYSGRISGSMDVSGGAADNHLLTSLQNGASYTISIVGTSRYFYSEHVNYPNSLPLSELLRPMYVIIRSAHSHCGIPSQFQAYQLQW